MNAVFLTNKQPETRVMLVRARSRPSQKQKMGGNRGRKAVRIGVIRDGDVLRSEARTRANTGRNGRKNQPRTVGFLNEEDRINTVDCLLTMFFIIAAENIPPNVPHHMTVRIGSSYQSNASMLRKIP